MTEQQSSIGSSAIDDDARSQFYHLARKHIDSLNPKYREKAVISRLLSGTIINILQNKQCSEKITGRFSRWCRETFVLRAIGGHYHLSDRKAMKPVLLYEDMYDVYRTSHIQTAHGGRDKCLEHIAVNYSWANRALLQIFIAHCSSCQIRKSIKTNIVSKPIIALGTIFF